jgi:hypothetical protein
MAIEEEIRKASNLELAKFLIMPDTDSEAGRRRQKAILREFERREKHYAPVPVESLIEIQRNSELLGVIKHIVYDEWLYDRGGKDEQYLYAVVELLNRYGWSRT